MSKQRKMTEDELRYQETLQQEQDDNDSYIAAFNAASGVKAPSADDNEDDPGADGESDESPDNKDLEDDEGYEEDDGAAASYKSKVASPSKGKASDDTSNGEPDPYAWIEELPEDVREQAKALKHQHASTKGRFAQYQKRLDEQNSELASLRTVLAQRQRAPAPPTKEEEQQVSTELQEFMDKYPQLAGAVKTLISQERQKIAADVDARLSPITEKEVAANIKAARDRLADGASEIFDTPNTGVHYTDVIRSNLYKDVFLPSQPKEYQQMARSTTDPDMALRVMRDFVGFAADYAQENGLTEDEQKIVPQRKPVNKADMVRTKRKIRQQEAARPHQRSAITDTEYTGSYGDDFNYWNRK